MIVAGFGPFGTVTENPSWILAQAVARQLNLTAIQLPTSYDRALLELQTIFDTNSGSVLMFGYARTVNGLRVESQAINQVTSAQPDIDGCTLQGMLQNPAGPDRKAVRYRVAELAMAIEAVGCDVQISTSAGGYVCNWVFFAALDQPDRLVSFIHVGDYIDKAIIKGGIAAALWLKQHSSS